MTIYQESKYSLVVGRVRALMTKSFWERVQIPAGDGCWRWAGATYSNYAALSIPQQRSLYIYAHIFSFFLHNGRWPSERKIICHTRRCQSKECCNPEHIYEGTHKTNAEDREFLKYGAVA